VESVERKIFDCPRKEGNNCPVAMKFKENNKGNPKGDVPIPEAFLGNPQSRFMIIGINPGASENYIKCKNFEEYQKWIREHLPSFWQYHYATEIFGNLPLKQGGGIVTNLVHCSTPSWRRQKEREWQLSELEKEKSLELCSQFCIEMIERVDPELILLHGLDTVRFFADHCGWKDIDKNAENEAIHGLQKTCNNRTFVLSRHLRSMCFKKGHEKWIRLKNSVEVRK
jgi:hypothetical protein